MPSVSKDDDDEGEVSLLTQYIGPTDNKKKTRASTSELMEIENLKKVFLDTQYTELTTTKVSTTTRLLQVFTICFGVIYFCAKLDL